MLVDSAWTLQLTVRIEETINFFYDLFDCLADYLIPKWWISVGVCQFIWDGNYVIMFLKSVALRYKRCSKGAACISIVELITDKYHFTFFVSSWSRGRNLLTVWWSSILFWIALLRCILSRYCGKLCVSCTKLSVTSCSGRISF